MRRRRRRHRTRCRCSAGWRRRPAHGGAVCRADVTGAARDRLTAPQNHTGSRSKPPEPVHRPARSAATAATISATATAVPAATTAAVPAAATAAVAGAAVAPAAAAPPGVTVAVGLVQRMGPVGPPLYIDSTSSEPAGGRRRTRTGLPCQRMHRANSSGSIRRRCSTPNMATASPAVSGPCAVQSGSAAGDRKAASARARIRNARVRAGSRSTRSPSAPATAVTAAHSSSAVPPRRAQVPQADEQAEEATANTGIVASRTERRSRAASSIPASTRTLSGAAITAGSAGRRTCSAASGRARRRRARRGPAPRRARAAPRPAQRPADDPDRPGDPQRGQRRGEARSEPPLSRATCSGFRSWKTCPRV